VKRWCFHTVESDWQGLRSAALHADPDPGFEQFADADQDPGCEKFADPDPSLHFYKKFMFIDVNKAKRELCVLIKILIRIQIQGLKKMQIWIRIQGLQKCGSNANPDPKPC